MGEAFSFKLLEELLLTLLILFKEERLETKAGVVGVLEACDARSKSAALACAMPEAGFGIPVEGGDRCVLEALVGLNPGSFPTVDGVLGLETVELAPLGGVVGLDEFASMVGNRGVFFVTDRSVVG
jgi:hypothetical protein